MIDFIDMSPTRNQREVETRLKEALKQDRARVQVGRISRFGLLEMSRQRLRPSLGESSQLVCPRCSGQGTVRSVESLALAVLRIIEEQAMKENTGRILSQLPVDVATYLLNEKRRTIHDIEKRQHVAVILVPNPNLETPHYTVERVRTHELPKTSDDVSSYQMTAEPEPAASDFNQAAKPKVQEPAVQRITPATPAPQPLPVAPEPPPRTGFMRRFWTSIFTARTGAEAEPEEPEAQASAPRRARAPAGRRSGTGAGQTRGGRRQTADGRRAGGARADNGKQAARTGRERQRSAENSSDRRRAPAKLTEPPQKTPDSGAARQATSGKRQAGADQQAAQRPEQAAREETAAAEAGNGPSKRPSSSRRGRRGGRRRRSASGKAAAQASGNQGQDAQPVENSQPLKQTPDSQATAGVRADSDRAPEPATKTADSEKPRTTSSTEPAADTKDKAAPSTSPRQVSEIDRPSGKTDSGTEKPGPSPAASEPPVPRREQDGGPAQQAAAPPRDPPVQKGDSSDERPWGSSPGEKTGDAGM